MRRTARGTSRSSSASSSIPEEAGNRQLDWDGCFNVRDLGGLRTADDCATRFGGVVRADDPGRLTGAGWSALRAYGIRTIVDLRNDHEIEAASGGARPADIATIHVPLDDAGDTEFWQHCWDNELDGSPLYYRLFLDRKPERCAAAVTAVARARPGGVVVHCGGGRDRTGLVVLLLLALADVMADDVAADYELSNYCLRDYWAGLGQPDEGDQIDAILARRKTSARALILDVLASLDVASYLRAGGVGEADLAAVRARLRGRPDA
jgi:protein-tyrosine phosphatase